MKRLGLAILLLLLCTLCACTDPPVDKVQIDEPARYMQVNDYVLTALEERFAGVLPSDETVAANAVSYHYEYVCAVLGDPNFLIHCALSFTDDVKMQQEIERVRALPGVTSLPVTGGEMLWISPNPEQLQLYMDDEIRDGTAYRFELVLIDHDAKTIEYLVAFQQDNAEKSAWIRRYTLLLGKSNGES